MTGEADAAIEWVRELYNNTGVSYTVFGELCGVSASAAQSWISGQKCPGKESLIKVGEAFGLEPPPHVLLSVEAYTARALERSIQAAKENRERSEKARKESEKKAFPYHFAYTKKNVCRRQRCEWQNRDGICNLPSCMGEGMRP